VVCGSAVPEVDLALPFGQIVILNGAPRSGKSSIVEVIRDSFPGCWINLGVDVSIAGMVPPRLRPGIGLRPGGERPDLEPLVPVLYAALYESIASHSRLGLNVIAEFGHHDRYTRPLGILTDCARRLAGLPVLFVGVRCGIETIMARRQASAASGDRRYVSAGATEPVPEPVLAWQAAVHDPGLYDMEVDTTAMTPAACAAAIRRRLDEGVASPTAFERLAKM
jgi:chloramphenicol 3-O phosphotransferase